MATAKMASLVFASKHLNIATQGRAHHRNRHSLASQCRSRVPGSFATASQATVTTGFFFCAPSHALCTLCGVHTRVLCTPNALEISDFNGMSDAGTRFNCTTHLPQIVNDKPGATLLQCGWLAPVRRQCLK